MTDEKPCSKSSYLHFFIRKLFMKFSNDIWLHSHNLKYYKINSIFDYFLVINYLF